MPALLPPARARLHQPAQAGHPSRLCRGPAAHRILQKVTDGGRINEIAYAEMSAGGTLAALDFAIYRDDDDPAGD